MGGKYRKDNAMTNEAKIKCRDLMIGDWVQDRHGNSIQVREILEDGINGEWDGGECYGVEAYNDEIQAIQLDAVREQVEAVTEITAEFDYLHEFQQYLRVTGKREEANKIKL